MSQYNSSQGSQGRVTDYIRFLEERIAVLEDAVTFLVKDVDKLLANRKLCDLCKIAIEKDEGK